MVAFDPGRLPRAVASVAGINAQLALEGW